MGYEHPKNHPDKGEDGPRRKGYQAVVYAKEAETPFVYSPSIRPFPTPGRIGNPPGQKPLPPRKGE
jgi:hypothetical protein